MDQQTEQIEFTFLSSKNYQSTLSTVGDIYQSFCTTECLDAFSKYLKEDRENLYDHKEYLAGVAYSQLNLFCENLPRVQNRLPFELLELLKFNLESHMSNIFGTQIGWILESIWVNFMRPGDFQPLHFHTGDLSFVWYIDVPQSIYKLNHEYKRKDSPEGSPYGEIHFHWPELDHSHHLVVKSLTPKTGDLLIFDARHQHVVYPFRENVERISVSGNIRLGRDG